MSQPWSAPILGTPVTNVLAGGTFVQIPSADAAILFDAGIVSDVTNSWRTLYPDVEMYDGGGVIGGDGGAVLAVNDDPSAIPDIPQAPDIANEFGELNRYLAEKTAEFWKKYGQQELITSEHQQKFADSVLKAQEAYRKANQDVIAERDKNWAEQQRLVDEWNQAEHEKALAEHFYLEDQKLLQGMKDAVKAAIAGALGKTAGELRAAGVGSTGSGGGGAGNGSGSGSGGAGSGGGKDKPKGETEADHAAHRAAGRKIQEETARRAKRDGPQAARDWATAETARYQAENPEGQPENPDFWKGYPGSSLIDGGSPLGGNAATGEKDGGLFWVLLAAAAIYAEEK